MTRTSFLAIAVLALVVAACEGGVLGETATPPALPSPAASPSAAADGMPGVTADEAPTGSTDMSPSGSPDGSPAGSPGTGPEATPGETRTIPFEPAGMEQLAGVVTLTEVGQSTDVTVAFENVSLPASAAVARMLVGGCGDASQAVGQLEVVDGRIEGRVPIGIDSITSLPHAIAIYESEDAAEPLACADIGTPAPTPLPSG